MRPLDTRIKKRAKDNRIKDFRLYNGWTQEQMARHLKLDKSTYCRIENGDIGKQIRLALKLAKNMKTTVEALWF